MILQRMLDIVDKVNDWVGKVMSFGLIVLMGIMVFEVVRRYVFHSPTMWAWSINGLLFSAIMVLGGGYVLLKEGHVRLEVFYERLGPRGRLIADIATFPISLVFLSILVWQGWRMASSSLSIQEALKVFPAPVYPTKIVFFIAIALILLQAIAIFIRNIASLRKSTKQGLRDVTNT